MSPHSPLPIRCCRPAEPNTPSRGHTGFFNVIYADSHVKNTNWSQIRTNDFFKFKLSKPTQTYSP